MKHRLDLEVEDILQHHGVMGMKWRNKKEIEDDEKDAKKEEPAMSEADAKMVNDIVRGNYGNGEERKKKLGDRYQELQDAVNKQLLGKSSKTESQSESKDKPKPKKTGKTKVIAKKSELKNIKKKLKPKNRKRSDGLLQQMLDLTTEGVDKLFSKFTD